MVFLFKRNGWAPLVLVGGEWLLRKRVVFLDQNVLLAKNLTFFF